MPHTGSRAPPPPPWTQGRGTGAPLAPWGNWGASRLSAAQGGRGQGPCDGAARGGPGTWALPLPVSQSPPPPPAALLGAWPGPNTPAPLHTPPVFIALLTAVAGAGVAACPAKAGHHRTIPWSKIQPRGCRISPTSSTLTAVPARSPSSGSVPPSPAVSPTPRSSVPQGGSMGCLPWARAHRAGPGSNRANR